MSGITQTPQGLKGLIFDTFRPGENQRGRNTTLLGLIGLLRSSSVPRNEELVFHLSRWVIKSDTFRPSENQKGRNTQTPLGLFGLSWSSSVPRNEERIEMTGTRLNTKCKTVTDLLEPTPKSPPVEGTFFGDYVILFVMFSSEVRTTI